MENIIIDLIKKINFFMDNMHHPKNKDLYRFCYEDELDKKPLLASSVFSTKIFYTIDKLSVFKKKKLVNHIKSFQKEDGYIYDKKIIDDSFYNRKFHALRTLNFNNWYGEEIKRAETRQAFSAIYLCGNKPEQPYKNIPKDKDSIKIYLDKLYWKNPWAAGSHVSHLVFFIKMNNLFFSRYSEYSDKTLIEFIFKHIEDNFRNLDGSWGKGAEISLNMKINGAMKMLNAYDLTEKKTKNLTKLIDLTLYACNQIHACDHLNAVYVLYTCSKHTDYRKKDISEFMKQMLNNILLFVDKKTGGFSFYKSPNIKKYYGAKLSKKKFQSDIHGTSLFVWMIAMISKRINLSKNIDLKIYLN